MPKWFWPALGLALLATPAMWLAVPRPHLPNTVKRLACTITVTETIDLYGSLATAANARAVENAIEQCWNGHRSNWCPVKFDITVRRYPNASTFLGTGDGGWNIKLVAPTYRSNVNRTFGWGTWQISSPAPTANDLWTFCHEAGHIFGLDDDYTDNAAGVSVPNPGHAGHMMASVLGTVAQHEINDLLKEAEVTCPDACCEVMR
ncbi:MAG TPA: hypothetical protein VK862_06200 [Afifellaceae bacterium]|nr:hypothetical protein [Afifellaceae bacterium]